MSIQDPSDHYKYSIAGINLDEVNEVFIHNHSAGPFDPQERNFLKLHPDSIEINSATFSGSKTEDHGPLTCLIQHGDTLLLSCSCLSVTDKLCLHQAQALYNIAKRRELRIFFDEQLREAEVRKMAEPYGLRNEPDFGQYFRLSFNGKSFDIKPVSKSILPVSEDQTSRLNTEIVSVGVEKKLPVTGKEQFVVFKQHKYYKQLIIELYEGTVAQNGKPKNPITRIGTAEKILEGDSAEITKFYFGIHQFQNNNSPAVSAHGLDGLKAILKNPLDLKFYRHQPEVSENIVAGSIIPLDLGPRAQHLQFSVVKKEPFYEIGAVIDLVHTQVPVEAATIRFDYFLEIAGRFHLAGNLSVIKVLEFLKQHHNKLLIHKSKYPEFQQNFLARLENHTEIKYEYLPAATPAQMKEHQLDQAPQLFIYLKDSDPYVELEPVMKYGDSEISILSKKQIYPQGIKRTFTISRDWDAETSFTALIIKQHPQFAEQAEDALPNFYLHKKHFLNENWFLKAFEEWRLQGIEVLGFNNLKENRLNPNPAKITVRVLSGIDWFNAEIDVKFGRKKASLKQVNKAIRNKSKYVPLDDGTLGILPEKWIEKFSEFFAHGDLEDHTLKIAKSNFTLISKLFEEEMIDSQVKEELQLFHERLSNFSSIGNVSIPPELNASLRDYQKQGLNWLNFLDDFNFGGCLADDMGLGKTLQILAFILSLRGKRANNINLLVVPTSLIHNWEAEIEKFAPTLKYHVLYGSKRTSDQGIFANYELIITTYGTLLSDIRFLKKYEFNYIFLDESQNIKNPDSQRYRAACLLRSRNRIVITGTPVENNSLDLFGQLSFASPGLLGSKQFFRDIYLNPIDQFGDRKRLVELQRKISPFVLRRTKAQVVKELPEKTEMILYCEMGPQQQAIYDAFEKEFREFICSKTNEELPRSSSNVLKGLTRLRQICNSPLLLNDDEINERASAKIEALVDQILNKTSQHKILIFSQFVSMLDLIGRELTEREIPYSYLTGSTKNRAQVVKQFQEEPDRRVFLISLKAGGIGLNLTQADYVYLVDPWWNPAVENQAIDRVYRIGQKKNVVAVRMICSGTIEEKMMHMQEGKKDLFDDLINSDPATGKSFTKEELLKLLNTPLA